MLNKKTVIVIDDTEVEFKIITNCIRSKTIYNVNKYGECCKLRKDLNSDYSGEVFISWIKRMCSTYDIVALMIDIEFLPKGNDKTGLQLLQFFREQSNIEENSDTSNFFKNTPVFIISKHDNIPTKKEMYSFEYTPNCFISKNGNELCEGNMINEVKNEIKVHLNNDGSRVINLYGDSKYIEKMDGNINEKD